ncbi:uncharacterized protein LOC124553378 [Schistocerca americana]|uniref:uncharacterized protein LOC124553378 n=1 Tax=Schistocerca americana TaxID=7009 RepID=UPI001F4F890E|nr:uncharacterized protein LOC124553378 [Schistocerca americana]
MRPATTTAAPAADISASAPRQTPAAAWPMTPQPDEATVSRMRRLSAKTRNMRLVHAAGKRAVGQLRALLAAGADVGARAGLEGRTALHWAARRGDGEAAAGGRGGGGRQGDQGQAEDASAPGCRGGRSRCRAAAAAGDRRPQRQRLQRVEASASCSSLWQGRSGSCVARRGGRQGGHNW